MSFKILKAGILDTIQDSGRFGYQHCGINPTGAMDRFSAQLANVLLGLNINAAVIEFHFPASEILFLRDTVICICGADFSPTIDHQIIPLHQPVAVSAHSILKFKQNRSGARAYMAFLHALQVEKWLNSYSTNLKTVVGGLCGRRLEKSDELFFDHRNFSFDFGNKKWHPLNWKASEYQPNNEAQCIAGSEWHWLTAESQESFLNDSFIITNSSDRMGYRLLGKPLQMVTDQQLVSSPVTFGTIQLLPTGQLILLMADHQTTGGYPRIAHVISTDLPKLAQTNPGQTIKFSLIDVRSAEEKLIHRQLYLKQLQTTCKLKMETFLDE